MIVAQIANAVCEPRDHQPGHDEAEQAQRQSEEDGEAVGFDEAQADNGKRQRRQAVAERDGRGGADGQHDAEAADETLGVWRGENAETRLEQAFEAAQC